MQLAGQPSKFLGQKYSTIWLKLDLAFDPGLKRGRLRMVMDRIKATLTA